MMKYISNYLLLDCVQFACCMGGWKEIHGTVLCSAPCCPGYTMKVERPPLLAPLVYCRCCTWVYVEHFMGLGQLC